MIVKDINDAMDPYTEEHRKVIKRKPFVTVNVSMTNSMNDVEYRPGYYWTTIDMSVQNEDGKYITFDDGGYMTFHAFGVALLIIVIASALSLLIERNNKSHEHNTVVLFGKLDKTDTRTNRVIEHLQLTNSYVSKAETSQ